MACRILVTLALWVGGILTPQLSAQTSLLQGDSFNLDDSYVNGFSEDGRIKVLLLTLAPSGMTETAAEQVGNAIELNLFNTNHFTVVGPSEWNAQLQARDPNLADCHDIACGILIGKIFNADKVIVGRIRAKKILDEDSREVEGFQLSVRLLDVLTNTTGFSDEVQFTDEVMQDELFKLAVRISENTLLRGNVVSSNNRTITVNWGRAHGVSEGDRIVVYTEPSTVVDLEGKTLGIQQKNVAVAQIHLLNDMTSEAIVMQRLETPQAGYFVKTYIDRDKQIELIQNTRREIDTQKRIKPRPPRILVEAQPISADTGREKWKQRLADAQSDRKFWMYTSIGGALLTVVILQTKFRIDFLGQANQFVPIMFGGATAYSAYRYFKARSLVNEIKAEGRVKKFIPPTFSWYLDVPQKQIGVAFKF